jgi:hypothetical protein
MTDLAHPWYARPVFFVNSCEGAQRFYERLGFRVAWRHEEQARLVALQVEREGLELILNENGERAGGGRLFLSLDRGQFDELLASCAAAGLRVSDGFWGMPVKTLQDLDGNDLVVYDVSREG